VERASANTSKRPQGSLLDRREKRWFGLWKGKKNQEKAALKMRRDLLSCPLGALGNMTRRAGKQRKEEKKWGRKSSFLLSREGLEAEEKKVLLNVERNIKRK